MGQTVTPLLAHFPCAYLQAALTGTQRGLNSQFRPAHHSSPVFQRTSRFLSWRDRQGKPERGSLTGSALHPNASLLPFNKLPA